MATRTNPGDALSSLRLHPRVALLACAALLAAGCQRNGAGDGFAGFGAQPEAAANARVTSVVNGALVTDRLATSTLERKQAAPGNRFVVLDVTARNTDRQPQVFSEGKLVNVSESRERTFTTPVSMLTGEYLTLQVLKPSSSVHGKIAYEVPEDLPGVLYWVPGNGNERILLHVAAVAVTTSAHAESDAGIAEQDAAKPEPGASPGTAGPAIDSPARPAASSADATPPPDDGATTAATPTPKPQANEGARVASIASPPAATVPARNEQARRLACGALVSRNDPAEKARYLGFFSRECEGYAMPPAWMSDAAARASPPVESPRLEPAGAPRWPPRPGPAFDCSQAYTRAEHLVCEDAVLSLMDWELSRAYANASRRVADQAALQRDEDEWRHRVRDACDTSRCVESAYNQRTAVLEAVAQGR